MGCSNVLRRVVTFLVVELVVAGVLMEVQAPDVVVIGAVAAVASGFAFVMLTWLGSSWRKVFSPTDPSLKPGPSPWQYVTQPFLVVAGIAFFLMAGWGFLNADFEERQALLRLIGNLAVLVLRALGAAVRAMFEAIAEAI